MNIAAVTGVAPHEQGLAGGLINTSFQFGGALVLAVVTAVNNANTGVGSSGQALLDGFHPAIAVSLVAALCGVLAMTLPGLRRAAAVERRRGDGARARAPARRRLERTGMGRAHGARPVHPANDGATMLVLMLFLTPLALTLAFLGRLVRALADRQSPVAQARGGGEPWPCQTSAWPTITRSPSKVEVGDPYSSYPSARASLTRRQKASSSVPVSSR